MRVPYFYAVLLARGPLARAVVAVWRVLFRDDEGRRARRGHEEHASSLNAVGAQHFIYPLLGRGRCGLDEWCRPRPDAIARRLACERHILRFLCVVRPMASTVTAVCSLPAPESLRLLEPCDR